MNRRVARLALSLAARNSPEPLRASAGSFLDDAAEQHADADAFYVYLYGVIAGWYLLALAAGLAMVGLAYLAGLAVGRAGQDAALIAGVGFTFFCVAGAADATWRSLVVYAARRRQTQFGVADNRVLAELRTARVDYPVLVAQALIGVAAAVVAALLL